MRKYGRPSYRRRIKRLPNKWLTSAVREIAWGTDIGWRQFSMIVAKFYKLISKPREHPLTTFPVSLFGDSPQNKMGLMELMLVKILKLK